ncbi:MAG TPA: hypothetical protein VEO54_04370 [Thermoanaerobaculia bacterium]|nr:hypothetical protein [Thermoanaerobaculia bacterium]
MKTAPIALLLLSLALPVAAREASLSFFINSVRNVDSVAETFDVDYYLLVGWDEPSVVTPETDWSTIWNPKVDSVNAINPGKQWEQFRLVRPGRVIVEGRYASTYNAPMDLRKFPFDRQVLPIAIESSTYRLRELTFLYEVRAGQPIRLAADQPFTVARKVALSEDIRLPEWTIEKVQVRERINRYIFDNNSEWSQFRIELVMSRNYGFYVWRVFSIQILIVMLSFLVFLHAADHFGERMSFSLTLFLAGVAFSFVTAGLIPRISYLTLLDVFMLGSYAVIFLTVVENAAVYVLAHRGRMAVADRLDRVSLFVFPLAFLSFLGALALFARG